MKWFLSFLTNKYTLTVTFMGMVACYLALRYDLRLRHNMILYGLIVSFPLVFSLQSAFKRRDRALEYLSLLRAGLESVGEAFLLCNKLASGDQNSIQTLLRKLQTRLFAYLRRGDDDPQAIVASLGEVNAFLMAHREEINKRIMLRIGKYMSYVYDSVSFLIAVKTHRTVSGVRIFSRVFVSLFPFVQAPILVNEIGDRVPAWSIFAISAFTSLALSALIVIQEQLEDPFDQNGIDDVKLEKFTMQKEVSAGVASHEPGLL